MVKLTLRPNFAKFGIGIAVLIVQFFLFINAEAVYGQEAAAAKDILEVYILLLTASIAITGVRPDIIGGDVDRLINFFFVFFVSSILLVAIPFVVQGWGLSAASSLHYILMQVFTVAYTEEVVFRAIFPEFLNDLLSAGTFGMFHWAVYGKSLLLVGVAVALGLMFAVVRDRFGITGAIGAHAAWNLKAQGVLDAIVRGTTA